MTPFNEGYAAFKDGKTNPYKVNSDEWLDWMKGSIEALLESLGDEDSDELEFLQCLPELIGNTAKNGKM